jgi:hypothetical protein
MTSPNTNSTTKIPPSRTISWQQEVMANDPLWSQQALRPVIYEFSNGRTFTRNPNPYTSSN